MILVKKAIAIISIVVAILFATFAVLGAVNELTSTEWSSRISRPLGFYCIASFITGGAIGRFLRNLWVNRPRKGGTRTTTKM